MTHHHPVLGGEEAEIFAWVLEGAGERLSNEGLAALIQDLDTSLGELAQIRAQLRGVLERRLNG